MSSLPKQNPAGGPGFAGSQSTRRGLQIDSTPNEPLAKARSERQLFGFQPIGDLLLSLKPPDWCIRHILESDSLALIYGEPESGKSFCGGVDMPVCVAAGIDWHGHRVKQAPVLCIFGEGKNGIVRRFMACALEHSVDLHTLPVSVATTNTALTDEIGAAELRVAVDAFMQTHGRPGLIVIDTLARNFGPGDENSTRDMSVAIAACDSIREITGATVLLIHHSGHADKTRGRGSIALRGAVDSEYRIHRENDGLIRFESTKMKDAPRPAALAFRLESVDLGMVDEEGEPVTSAVLKPANYVPATPQGKAGRGKHQQTALRVLQELAERHASRLTTGGHDPGTARVTVEDWRNACVDAGIDRRRLQEVSDSLLLVRKIEISFGYVSLVGGDR